MCASYFTDEACITGDFSDYMNELPYETALLCSYDEKNGELNFDEKHKLYYNYKYRMEQMKYFWKEDLDKDSEEYALWHEDVKAAQWIDKKVKRDVSNSRIAKIDKWYDSFKAEKDRLKKASEADLAGTPFGTYSRALVYSRCCMHGKRKIVNEFDTERVKYDHIVNPWKKKRLATLLNGTLAAPATPVATAPPAPSNARTASASVTSAIGSQSSSNMAHEDIEIDSQPRPELYRLDEIKSKKYKDGMARKVYGLPYRKPTNESETKCWLRSDIIYKNPLVAEVMSLERWPFDISKFELTRRRNNYVQGAAHIDKLHGYFEWFGENKYTTVFRGWMNDAINGGPLPADNAPATVERLSQRQFGAFWYTFCKVVFQRMNDINDWSEVKSILYPLQPNEFFLPLVKNIGLANMKTNFHWGGVIIDFIKTELKDYNPAECKEYVHKLDNPDNEEDNDEESDDYWDGFFVYVCFICVCFICLFFICVFFMCVCFIGPMPTRMNQPTAIIITTITITTIITITKAIPIKMNQKHQVAAADRMIILRMIATCKSLQLVQALQVMLKNLN